MKKLTIEVPDGKKAEWVNGVLTLVDEKDKRPVTERIKTFDDALKELGQENPLVKQYLAISAVLAEEKSDVVAYLKLRIIAAALNEGWEPQFKTGEYRWYPLYYLYKQEEIDKMSEEWKKKDGLWLFGGSSHSGAYCGLAFAHANAAWSYSYSDVSPRLAVKSEKLADYFGRQFIEIWAEYVGPFNRG